LFAQYKTLKAVAVITSLPATTYIICMGSRAAVVGLLVAGFFVLNGYTSFFKSLQRKIITGVFFLILVFILVFYVKSKSSAGRLHIYSIGLNIYKDNWLTGIGTGRFKAVFNEYQAAYFEKNNINNERALLADNTFYAFNDYLQWMIETGLSGAILLFVILLCLAFHIYMLYKKQRTTRIITAACSGLLCIGTASLFSYPMQVWTVQFLTLFLVLIILIYPGQIQLKRTHRQVLYFFRLVLVSGSLASLYNGYEQIKRRSMEKQASQLARTGYKNKAIDVYKQLVNKWPAHGHNRLLLAEQFI
jgi:O-antigen ligase